MVQALWIPRPAQAPDPWAHALSLLGLLEAAFTSQPTLQLVRTVEEAERAVPEAILPVASRPQGEEGHPEGSRASAQIDFNDSISESWLLASGEEQAALEASLEAPLAAGGAQGRTATQASASS